MYFLVAVEVYLSILATVYSSTDAARILGIFPIQFRSHFGFNMALMESLANVGHNVTSIAPFDIPNTHENVHIVNSALRNFKHANTPLEYDFKKNTSWQQLAKLLVTEVLEKDCYDLLKLPFVQNLLHSNQRHYDVMFVELMEMWECYLPLAQKLQIPVIGTISTALTWPDIDEVLGNPHPFVLPSICGHFPQRMSFFQRLHNVYIHLDLRYFYYTFVSPKVETFFQSHYPHYDLKMSNGQPSLLFINGHSSIMPRAHVPTVSEVGGIHIQPAKPLSKDIKKFIDEAEHGVILFSFGSWTRSEMIGSELERIFVNVFSRLHQRVIWKYESEISNLSSNVLRMSWIPQRDILAEGNVKLFITHCGANSMLEAIYTANPIIMIPIFADQQANAALLHEQQVGINLNIYDLTTEILLNAIRTVLADERYTSNMRKLSQAFANRPMSPSAAAVYWTEYVLKFNGTKHLRTFAADIPLYQYLLLDVFAFVVLIFIFVITLFYFAIREIYISYVKSSPHRNGKMKTR